jgi:hypothetical protein
MALDTQNAFQLLWDAYRELREEARTFLHGSLG